MKRSENHIYSVEILEEDGIRMLHIEAFTIYEAIDKAVAYADELVISARMLEGDFIVEGDEDEDEDEKPALKAVPADEPS